MADDLVRIRDVLDGLGVRIGLGRSQDTGIIWSRWPDIVGDGIAGHAEPTSLRAGVLRVRADSPVWAVELGYLAGEIKQRANDLIGRSTVTEVRVWTGPGKVKPRSHRSPEPSDGKAPDGGARPPSDDPVEAFERARAAWRRRRASEAAERR
ncbi:MAG: DUF721 domain-containing protein [Actinomycetota bacterium]